MVTFTFIKVKATFENLVIFLTFFYISSANTKENQEYEKSTRRGKTLNGVFPDDCQGGTRIHPFIGDYFLLFETRSRLCLWYHYPNATN